MPARSSVSTRLQKAAAALAGLAVACYTTVGYTDYVPYYDGWTVAYSPLYVASDPFYYGYVPYYPRRPSPDPAPSTPNTFDELAPSAAIVNSVNVALQGILAPVEALARGDGSDNGAGRRLFGPADLPTSGAKLATYRLFTRQLTGQRFAYQLQAKPLGASDDHYIPVMSGTSGSFTASRRGRGALIASFDNLHGVNPAAFPARGTAIIAAAQGNDAAKGVLTRLIDFQANGTSTPYNGILAGDRDSDNLNHFRVPYTADAVQGGGDEDVVSRFAWQAAGGGQALSVITNGGVDAGTYVLLHSCWAAPQQLVFREWRTCAQTETPSNCLSDAAAVIRVDIGKASACTGPAVFPPATFDAPLDQPTETTTVTPPILPTTLPLDLQ
jgi:hypothetical protein